MNASKVREGAVAPEQSATEARTIAQTPNQTMLYIGGSKSSYRHTCGSNVFVKLARSDAEAESIREFVPISVPYVYRCNGCYEFVWEDTEVSA